jgi:hypothetical protein
LLLRLALLLQLLLMPLSAGLEEEEKVLHHAQGTT